KSVIPYCVASTGAQRLAGAVASLTCPLTAGAAQVSWDYFDQLPTLITSFEAFQRQAGSPEGDCATAARGGGPWSPIQMVSGEVLCYPEGGHANIVWSYLSGDGQGILATATRDDTNWEALYQWFAET